MDPVAAVTTPTTPGGAPPTEAKPQVTDTPKPQDAKPTDAAPKTETQPEKPPEPRFYERKVNGKTEKIPADAIDAAAKALGLNPNEILSVSQLKRAAYEKFEQAEKARKEVESLRGIKDPWKLAQQLAGLDDAALDQAAEQRLIAKLQREAMDPAQRQLLEERERLAKEREQIEAQKREHQERALAEQSNAIRQRLEPMVLDAIEKAGLPRTPDAVRAVVAELERQHKYGLPLDPVQAASDAKAGFFQPSVAMLRNMSAEAIIREIGKEKYDELIRFSLQQRDPPPPPPPQSDPKPQGERFYLTEKEWKQKYG